MTPCLILHPGTIGERTFALKPGSNTIGRTRENDVWVSDQSLSRAHARIDVSDEGVVLRDPGSKNGTFVDGVRIDRQVLGDAHLLMFGEVSARYVLMAAAPSMQSLPTPALTRSMSTDLTHMSIGELIAAGRRGPLPLTEASSATAIERDRNKLRILLKVSQLLASQASLDATLSNILDLAFEILDIDRAAILMIDPRTGDLEPRITRARKGDSNFSRSIARYVMDYGVAALFSDAKTDMRLAEAGSVLLQSIRTSMCAPLNPRDQVLGVLYVDNLTLPNRFNAQDLEFLSSFANQVAIAIDNSILSERLASEAVTRNNLLRFFPPTALPAILKEGGNGLATIERDATVLFSDISGYTSMSSRMKPREMLELLNGYFPVMAQIVFRHEGTLEKYIGDALLAVWGVPLERDDDAERAVRAAIEMHRAVTSLNERWAGKRELGIHIGLSTGTVAAGNIGSKEYIQYAAIGDTTNVSSRICGVARRGEIVVDARTAERVRGLGVNLTSLGPVALRGKPERMPLFRVDWA